MRTRITLVALALTVSAALTTTSANAESTGAGPQVGQLSAKPPGKDSSIDLVDGELRDRLEAIAVTQAPDGELTGFERVEVVSDAPTAELRALVESLGGTVDGAVEGEVLQAVLPRDQLVTLEADPLVDFLRSPLDVSEPTNRVSTMVPALGSKLGAHVQKTNAAAWHQAGFTGSGVKIGVIDSFDGAAWTASQASGDLVIPAATICRSSGAACNIWAGGSTHGVSVAEVVLDEAPGVTMYLGSAVTVSDLQAVVDFMVANGVKIITRSLTARYDGAGSGDGPLAAVVDNAVAHGITWFNSAGNSAGPWAGLLNQGVGSYWRGAWVDADGDGWLEFASGDETMAFNCDYINGVRWSDWGAAATRTDYDVYVYDDDAATTLVSSSKDNQPGGAVPIEIPGCSSAGGGIDYLAVYKYAAGSGTAGDVLEFMVNGSGVQYWQNPYSAAAPAADSANPGMLAVGAVGEDPFGTSLSPYSSRGPTNNGRTKPDVSAATCVSTVSNGAACFNGTSAATPVAAGLGALVLGAGLATTPAALTSYLRGATVDRGAVGPDNDFGVGELILPAPPTGAGVCPPDDAMEPNDSVGTATVSSTGVPLQGTVCTNNADWFTVEAFAGQTVTVNLAFSHAAGDLDLRLRNPAGVLVATGASATDNEMLSAVATSTGIYSVEVYGYDGAQNSYELSVSSPTCPPNDAFEPNDLHGTATSWTGPVSGIICVDDQDWFSVNAVAGATIAVSATFLHRHGDLDIAVYDAGGTVIGSAASATDDEVLSVVTGSTGLFRVVVDGYQTASNVYGLAVSVTPPAAPTSAIADFDGDGVTDRSAFRPAVGGWYVQGQPTQFLGLSGDTPVPADYDGDGVTERAVFRAGTWFVQDRPTEYVGLGSDVPAPADYDGDGDADAAVFRDGAWFVSGRAVQFHGSQGDVPVPGDYDGDGDADLAVFRGGGWYVQGLPTTYFGLPSDIPVPADYDGDGVTDRAVYRPSTGGWYVEGKPTTFLGLSTDVPVPGDFDGNGTVDPAVFRPAAGGWYVGGQATTFYGLGSDVPLPLPAATYHAYF